jgi:hypothetical protein
VTYNLDTDPLTDEDQEYPVLIRATNGKQVQFETIVRLVNHILTATTC